MTQHELERRREELEARYRVALEILEAGHRALLEKLERQWQIEREPELAPPTPAGTPRTPRNESLLDELRDALDQLPDEFRKDDALRVLGFSPHRSTLFRALQNLEWEGRIAVAALGKSRQSILYRQVRPGNKPEAPR
jgi:hypothetical protein